MRHPLSIDTPSTLSPVRLSVQGGQNQPEPTPALEALYRGFERELMVLLGTEIGDLCRYIRSRRLRRMSGAGSGCWSSPTKPGISYRWAVAASAVRSPCQPLAGRQAVRHTDAVGGDPVSDAG